MLGKKIPIDLPTKTATILNVWTLDFSLLNCGHIYNLSETGMHF